ncbi:pyridoxal phosphate-dependent aminotransferase [candidate division WOR-3 bacterium]|nr:pyridoxal phosphate-dependent aminotransferase [candidate division WOR-3 bacterium]
MFAKRVEHLTPTAAFEFLANAKKLEAQGKSIIHLEIGEPDFDTPENITEAAIKALKDGYTKYAIGQGLPELRETIADYIKKTRGIDVGIDEIVVGAGGSAIVFFTILAVINPGDEVLYPDPCWFVYEPTTILANGVPKPYHLPEEKGFSIDIDEIRSKISERTKLIIINSPQNPTGGILSDKDLSDLAELLRDKDIWIMSDEVYSRILFEGEFRSITQYPAIKKKTIIVESLSKTYAMPGLRLGYGVMDPKLAYKVTSLSVQCNSCTPPFIQIAGIEALAGKQDIIEERCEIYRKRRDIMTDGLNSMPGIKCVKPNGAIYAFPNIKELGIPSRDLALRLLDEVGVCCLPGTAFGRFAEGYIRFTYANSESNIQEALRRIRKVVESL